MSENQNLTKKRWSVLIVSCIINVMIGTGYAWSMFVGPLNEHFVAMGSWTLALRASPAARRVR